MAVNVPNLQQAASTLPDEVQRTLGAALRSQDAFNVSLGALLNASAPWEYPELQNGWLPFSATSFPRYREEMGLGFRVVRLEGRVASGTVGATVFTLPEALRPAQDLSFAIASNGAFGQLNVTSDGNVVAQAGSNVSFNLNVAFGLED